MIKDVQDLLDAGVITQETATKIQNYYSDKGELSQNRLFVIFGILGAILVGLGIILIIAHNWDGLPKAAKVFFAFLPLVLGQVACAYALLRSEDSVAWKEGAAAVLFFAVGASISLIAQIYNISGDLSSFLLTWMLLGLPLVYLMRSSVVSLLYLGGITFYAVVGNYSSYTLDASYLYWLLLLVVLPHYYRLYKETPFSNFMIFHNWAVPLSLMIALGTLSDENKPLMYVAYFSLYGIFYILGNSSFFAKQRPKNNGYLTIGSLGTLFLLLWSSFDSFWERIRQDQHTLAQLVCSPEFIACVILSLIAGILLYRQKRGDFFADFRPIELVFLLFIVTFIIGQWSSAAVILVNLYLFGIGIYTIKNGAKLNHLGILNFGLLIMMALAVSKFFDSDWTFVVRGLLFLSVGIGFFVANYRMLKKRKQNA